MRRRFFTANKIKARLTNSKPGQDADQLMLAEEQQKRGRTVEQTGCPVPKVR